MPLNIPINSKFDCSQNNPIFIENIDYLNDLIKPYIDTITSIDQVEENIITSLGDNCLAISKTKIDSNNGDLFDETNYKNIFTGEYSDLFIEILCLIQKFWQLSSHLDTYPTIELADNGVRQKDKEYFYKNLYLLNNKLRLLKNHIKKTESF